MARNIEDFLKQLPAARLIKEEIKARNKAKRTATALALN
jgi:hypothetical protein